MVDKVYFGASGFRKFRKNRAFCSFLREGIGPALILIGIYALILVAACALVVESLRAGDFRSATVYGVAIILLALYLLQCGSAVSHLSRFHWFCRSSGNGSAAG